MKAVNKFLYGRPWIWIVFAFIVMLCAMISVVVIAERYKPQSVVLDAVQ